MNKLILFLLESSVILGVLYTVYYVFLRKEASFNFNRFYLIGAVIISLILPLISMDFNPSNMGIISQPIEQLSEVRKSYQETVENWSTDQLDQDFSSFSIRNEPEAKGANWILTFILIVYFVGAIAMAFRLVWMIRWIFRLKFNHDSEIMDGVRVVKLPFQIAPFSFLSSVFVSNEMIESNEFSHILEHEKTHIQQRHSIDLLIVQLMTVILWFNPVIWWFNKSLKTTHEYIADRKMITQGYSLVEYQTLLLRQLISNNSFGLVHNFNLSFIKKRITMMNIQKLGSFGKFKVASVIILTALFSLVIIQCNSKLDEQDLALVEETTVNLPEIQTEYAFDIKEDLRFDITITDDKVYFKGELISLEGLSKFDGNFPENAQIVLEVDKDEKMKLVHEVQEVLREKDLRMIVYQGKGESGELLNVPILLPPGPNSKSHIKVPTLTNEFIKENGIHMLEIDMNVEDVPYDAFTYNALHDPMIPKGSFVFRGRYTDDTSYEAYLTGLNEIKNGFYRFYDERAQEMFGKSFFDINREQQKGDEESKEQYHAVRKGIPMSIVLEKK